jgi:hypothetical protein
VPPMVDPIVPPATGAAPVSATPPAVPVAPAAPGRPVVLPDGWTVTVTDKIVSTVDSVRSKTTKPITTVARGLVYGLILAVAGIFALVVLLVGFFRGVYVLVGLFPWWVDTRNGRSVWIVDLAVGLALIMGGSWIMRKGRIPKADATTP